MDNIEIDPFTCERILNAAARGETIVGHEALGDLLVAYATPDPATGVTDSLPAAALTQAGTPHRAARLTRRTGAAAVAAFFAFSGAAAALTGGIPLVDTTADAEDEAEDTDFNFGYDEEYRLFVYNTSPRDGQYDCTLENGALNPTYGVDGDDVSVDDLTEGEGGDTVTFPDRNDETADPLTYSPDEDCALDAAEVSGPNGQVNHGMFMKLWNSLYEGQGRGCLNRHLAQSDLGKGDQQVKAGDETEFVPVADGDTGEVTFETIAADCERPNREERGKPEHAGKPDDADHPGQGPNSDGDGEGETPRPRGKSADAPGKNKNK